MSIREIPAAAITDAVEALCIEANTRLPADVKAALDAAEAAEPWPLAKETLGLLQQNLCVAKEKDLPICQDTGMACVFIELGQDAHIDGDLTDAVNEGVRRGYEKAFLRKSITADPLQRVNTGDNTPAFLTVHLVPGSGCKITVAPVKFVAGDPAEVTTTFINATKDLNVLLWPGDAYKNADKCKQNIARQMTDYYHIDISGIEFDTVEYKEATEEAAAHVEITVKAKTQH